MTAYQYEGEELELFRNAKNWKSYFAKFIIPFIKGRVLEVGAGLGETTPYLFNPEVQKWTCLEPDKRFFDQLLKQINAKDSTLVCHVQYGSISTLEEKEQFDTIIYIDVLEHIKNDREEILSATKHLKLNGHLIILSPAYPFFYSNFDKAIGHYRRYTKKSLRLTVNLPSLKKKNIFYLESVGTFLLLINKIFTRKKYPSEKQIRFWDNIIVPISEIADKLVFYSFGKTIIGIWQKQL